MATKWKSFSRNIVTKIVLSFLAVASAATVCGMFGYVVFINNVNIETVFEKDYISSREHAMEVSSLLMQMENFLDDKNALTQEEVNGFLGSDIWYYFSNGTKSYTNVQEKGRSFFEEFATSYIIEDGLIQLGQNSNLGAAQYYHNVFVYGNGKSDAYIAFTDNYIAQKEAGFKADREQCVHLFYQAAAIAVLFLICIIWLFIVAGKKKEDEEIHLCWLDSVYTEVIFFAGILLFYFGTMLVTESGYYWSLQILLAVLLGAAVSVGMLALMLSLVRRLKSRTFLSQCLIVKCFHGIWDFFAGLFDGRRFKKYKLYKDMVSRELLFAASEVILIFLTFSMSSSVLMLLPLGAGIMLLYFFLRGRNQMFTDMGKLLNQIDQISEGELNSITDIHPDSPLFETTCKLADIGSGMSKSIEKQIRDERMKIDLVTNVSHDLKTPLTSIIGYIDLMEKEEGLSPEMQDYVRILSQKAGRLKNIVSDLFDLAKTTSGNAEIQMERLDLCKLIIQTLGDMDDKIQSSEQNIKAELPDFPVHIMADGKKLYRVFQNIVENALKYSLPGTRIFIQLAVENGRVYAMVKNTASYEMNFTAEEILERFSRGDKARTTDGSGLGLSIAESFTQVCGGQFYVVVDGDQFKTSIVFDVID